MRKIMTFLFGVIFFLKILHGQTAIAPSTYGENLRNFLVENYKTTSTLGYTACRDTMYAVIDLKDGNQLTGVYSGYTITLDLGQDPSTNAYEQGINCEHTFPQSLYDGSEPMKSDIHHLFPTKSNVNSSRGNDPFEEIADDETHIWYRNEYSQTNIPEEYIDEFSEKYNPSDQNDERFEPRENQKGNSARAMFYFYTMYSNVADDEFWELQKETLFNWHYFDSTDEIELERTWKIAEYQDGLPNPFIIDPTLVWRAYFSEIYLPGDLNSDTSIDVLDVVMVTSNILFILEFNQIQYHQSDLNTDFSVDIIDVVLLIGIILQ